MTFLPEGLSPNQRVYWNTFHSPAIPTAIPTVIEELAAVGKDRPKSTNKTKYLRRYLAEILHIHYSSVTKYLRMSSADTLHAQQFSDRERVAYEIGKMRSH